MIEFFLNSNYPSLSKNQSLNERNVDTMNSYIYSLPNLIDDNFPGGGNNSFRVGSKTVDFSESQASFLQAQENQILLKSPTKSSSDEMLKKLLEKFEIIYNEAVIQSRPQLPNHSLDLSTFDNQLDS